ncbi:MAG: ferredoxin [Streptosporangiales bacterium]|nr:ferredoxin [Streptosporangiales bacterium]
MKVWIDQEECTGSGLCELIEPEVFTLGDDGLAYVREGDRVLPGGAAGSALVSQECEDNVLEARQGCPGRCIQVED